MGVAAKFGSCVVLAGAVVGSASPAEAQFQIGNLYGVAPAIVEEAITVVSEAPLLDRNSPLPVTHLTSEELERLPGVRDPAAVLRQAPGVVVDRINVGGNYTGFDAYVVVQGTSPGGNTFIVDGVEMTDLGAPGTVPSYLDFRDLEEFDVTTGARGPDYGNSGGGVFNSVTKSGTTQFHGGGRYYHTDDFSFGTAEKSRAPLTPIINHADDYGVNFGGPISKDKLWFHGGYNRQVIDRQQNAIGLPYDASNSLRGIQLNGSYQINKNDRISIRGDYSKRSLFGPSSLTRSLDATWNTAISGNMFKIEERHLFNEYFSLTGSFAYVDPSIKYNPRGGTTTPASLTTDDRWLDNYFAAASDRPRQAFRIDGTRLFQHRWGRDTLNLGLRHDTTEQNDAIHWPGDKILFREATGIFTAYPGSNHVSVRDSQTMAWGEKTAELGRLTLHGGVSLLHDNGSVQPSEILKNPIVPTFVPGFQLTSPLSSFNYTKVLPQAGITATFGPAGNGDYLLRANYARYVDHVASQITNYASPIQGGDSVRGALVANGNFVEGYFAPLMDTKQFAVGDNQLATDLTPAQIDNLLFGVEHALLPEFVVGVNLTYRKITDILIPRDLVVSGTTTRPATGADYTIDAHVTGTLPTGDSFASDLYRLRQGLQYAPNNGLLLTNSDTATDYKGVEIFFNKRLSNRWMLRGNLNFSNWTWDVPDSEKALRYPGLLLGQGNNGDPVALQSPAPDMAGVFLNSKWSYNVNGLYDFSSSGPLHLGVTANVTGSQGFPLPYYAHITGSDGRARNLQLPPLIDPGELRTQNFHIAALGLFARPEIIQRFNATIDFSVSNLFGSSTPRQYGLNMADTALRGQILERLGPRVSRLGVRFEF